MYRAVYDYQATDSTALTFESNDQFTVIDARDHYWWLVQNGFGKVGYVPANYLQKDDVAEAEVLKSIDRAIEAIHFQATCAGSIYSVQQRSNLQKLLQHRRLTIEQQNRHKPARREQRGSGSSTQPYRTAPKAPDCSNQQTITPQQERHPSQTDHNQITRIGSHKSRRAPPPPPRGPSSLGDNTPRSSGSSNSPSSPQATSPEQERQIAGGSITVDQGTSPFRSAPQQRKDSTDSRDSTPQVPTEKISEDLALELVELVRRNTDLSYDKSRIAVGTVLGQLRESVPGISNIMDEILKNLIQIKRESSNLEGSKDAVRLEVIFSEMAACKDDSQQRSWALHEDESVITEYLTELVSILDNANPEICRHSVAKDGYDAVDTLVLYYQMETRVSIRLLLLQVFGALCGLDARVISELLNSVLPLELARDMQTDTQDIQKLCYSALVLTMMFSRAEAIPIQHYAHLSRSFIQFLLESVEHPPETDDNDQVPDLYVNLILAFNLHFEVPEDNLVMDVLDKSGTAKTFTEKLMLLVNRGVDPVRMFEHEPQPPDSLLKFLCDLFSKRSTSGLLYTNDARVLIDIVLRQLIDLLPGDKIRTEYLSLAQLIIKNSDYAEHQHKRAELQSCFNKIGQEEDIESQMDRLIVIEIWKDASQMFPRPKRT